MSGGSAIGDGIAKVSQHCRNLVVIGRSVRGVEGRPSDAGRRLPARVGGTGAGVERESAYFLGGSLGRISTRL